MRRIDKSISSRDKTLLTFLIVILVLFVAYYFFISTQIDTYLSSMSELKTAEQDLATIDNEIASLDELRNQKEEQITAIKEKIKPFFYELKDDRLLNQFNTLMEENNLKAQNYSATIPVVTTIDVNQTEIEAIYYPILDAAAKVNPDLQIPDDDQSNKESANNESANDNKNAEDSLVATTISISFYSTAYDAVIGYIKSIEAMDKAIVINGITITSQSTEAGNTGLVQGQLNYTLYSLAKPDNSEKDYLAYSLIIPKGKVNPFN